MANVRITDLNEATVLTSSFYYLVYDPRETKDRNADGYIDYNKIVKLKNICTQVSQSAITWFGTGANKVLNTTSSVTFTSTTDGDPIVRHYEKLIVNAGHTLTVSNRCKGLVFYVNGDCTINGTVTMTAKGAKATGSYAHYVYQAKNYHGNFIPQYVFQGVAKIFGSGSGGGAASTNGLSAGDGYTGGGGGGYNGAAGSAGKIGRAHV